MVTFLTFFKIQITKISIECFHIHYEWAVVVKVQMWQVDRLLLRSDQTRVTWYCELMKYDGEVRRSKSEVMRVQSWCIYTFRLNFLLILLKGTQIESQLSHIAIGNYDKKRWNILLVVWENVDNEHDFVLWNNNQVQVFFFKVIKI